MPGRYTSHLPSKTGPRRLTEAPADYDDKPINQPKSTKRQKTTTSKPTSTRTKVPDSTPVKLSDKSSAKQSQQQQPTTPYQSTSRLLHDRHTPKTPAHIQEMFLKQETEMIQPLYDPEGLDLSELCAFKVDSAAYNSYLYTGKMKIPKHSNIAREDYASSVGASVGKNIRTHLRPSIMDPENKNGTKKNQKLTFNLDSEFDEDEDDERDTEDVGKSDAKQKIQNRRLTGSTHTKVSSNNNLVLTNNASKGRKASYVNPDWEFSLDDDSENEGDGSDDDYDSDLDSNYEPSLASNITDMVYDDDDDDLSIEDDSDDEDDEEPSEDDSPTIRTRNKRIGVKTNSKETKPVAKTTKNVKNGKNGKTTTKSTDTENDDDDQENHNHQQLRTRKRTTTTTKTITINNKNKQLSKSTSQINNKQVIETPSRRMIPLPPVSNSNLVLNEPEYTIVDIVVKYPLFGSMADWEDSFQTCQEEVVLYRQIQTWKCPFLLRYYGTHGPGLVFEYVDGESLDSLLFHSSDVDIESQTWLFSELGMHITTALFYLHKLNISHNDIKPENVRYSASKKLWKLLDLGLATDFDMKVSRQIGTNGYRSPEVEKNGRLHLKSDIYGLGVMMDDALDKIIQRYQILEDIYDDFYDIRREAEEEEKNKSYKYKGGKIDLDSERIEVLQSHIKRRRMDTKSVTLEAAKECIHQCNVYTKFLENARELIKSMLDTDPDQRPSVKRCLHIFKQMIPFETHLLKTLAELRSMGIW
jgi:hypothetical protein